MTDLLKTSFVEEGSTIKERYSEWLDSNVRRIMGLLTVMMTQRTEYTVMINHLLPDVEVDGRVFLGLRRAPAAKFHHHAREGGLLQHILEMWNCWMLVQTRYTEVATSTCMTDELVLKAIINHDLHKACKTYVLIKEDPWQADYAKGENRDRLDILLPQDVKTLALLGEFGISLSPELLNTLIWSEGGWSLAAKSGDRVERPPLAVLMYLLDEFSGNVLDRLRSRNFVP